MILSDSKSTAADTGQSVMNTDLYGVSFSLAPPARGCVRKRWPRWTWSRTQRSTSSAPPQTHSTSPGHSAAISGLLVITRHLLAVIAIILPENRAFSIHSVNQLSENKIGREWTWRDPQWPRWELPFCSHTCCPSSWLVAGEACRWTRGTTGGKIGLFCKSFLSRPSFF